MLERIFLGILGVALVSTIVTGAIVVKENIELKKAVKKVGQPEQVEQPAVVEATAK